MCVCVCRNFGNIPNPLKKQVFHKYFDGYTYHLLVIYV